MDSDRFQNFEAKLAALRHKMERGLIDRAAALREMADRLESGDENARREIKTESHKLRGVAGTYGHQNLTDLAGEVEQRASMSPPATVGRMARELAELAETTGKQSSPPGPPEVKIPATPPTGTGGARERIISGRPKVTTAEGHALRVLAMDDDPVTQRLLKLTLREVGGFSAEIVDNASRALELLAQRTFDVIISDAMMPDMNGKEFYRAARERGFTMPIVILSAASPDELGWIDDMDAASTWMRKPFKPSQLVHDIAKIVDEHKS